jgi:hypothetical protein
MSTQRKNRKEVQNSKTDPINYTCGICFKVHEFDPEKPYVCPNVDEVLGTPEEES